MRMNDILDEIERILKDGESAVVATIVRTKGSTPREVGARMVVRSTGKTHGTVGGGCGEAEVWSESMEVLKSQEPRLIEVDLLHDEDAEGGRACGGLMYVFLEPLTFTHSV
jgi:xanthine dehydrogenase accessory factor